MVVREPGTWFTQPCSTARTSEIQFIPGIRLLPCPELKQPFPRSRQTSSNFLPDSSTSALTSSAIWRISVILSSDLSSGKHIYIYMSHMANGFWRENISTKEAGLICFVCFQVPDSNPNKRASSKNYWKDLLWALVDHQGPLTQLILPQKPWGVYSYWKVLQCFSTSYSPHIFDTPWMVPNMWLHALLNHGFRGMFNITGKGLVIWNLNRSISTGGPLKKISSIIETLWQDPLRLAGTTAYSHDWTLTKLCRFHHLAMIFLRLLHWPWNKQIYLALSRYKKVRAPPL